MSDLEIWITIFGLTLVTLFTRSSFFLLPEHFRLPPNVQRALRYAPACALLAIIAPDLLLTPTGAPDASLDVSPHNFRLIAALGAGVLFFYTRNMLLIIVVGMLTYTVLRVTA